MVDIPKKIIVSHDGGKECIPSLPP